MRLALKFAYLGGAFHGYQRQPGLRTVEGDILAAMRHLGIAKNVKTSRFESASRTDAGVSALGNVLAVDTDFRVRGICRALNSRLEDVWFWAVATVPPEFNPRHAQERRYRYHLPDDLDIGALRRAARVFEGSHDFRAFTRDRRATSGEITAIRVARGPLGPLADFRAPSFLWNLVRRVVGAMEAHARGDVTLGDLRASLRTGPSKTGLAPPGPLLLMDVLYDRTFEPQTTGAMVGEVRRRLITARAHVELLALLAQSSSAALPEGE